jgi:hypothetical protein
MTRCDFARSAFADAASGGRSLSRLLITEHCICISGSPLSKRRTNLTKVNEGAAALLSYSRFSGSLQGPLADQFSSMARPISRSLMSVQSTSEISATVAVTAVP